MKFLAAAHSAGTTYIRIEDVVAVLKGYKNGTVTLTLVLRHSDEKYCLNFDKESEAQTLIEMVTGQTKVNN